MKILGERPVWSMSGSEMLSCLDAAYAEMARLETFTLHRVAGLESTGYAKDVGAGDTARLLTFRYRIDASRGRREVRLAGNLAKYPAVAAAPGSASPNLWRSEAFAFIASTKTSKKSSILAYAFASTEFATSSSRMIKKSVRPRVTGLTSGLRPVIISNASA
jgi:hypothetical protein